MSNATTIAAGKNQNGLTVRLQQRGGKFDVTYCTGFCWKYIVKAGSENAARNEFELQTLKMA
jgi:hypothetical protein